MHGPAKFVLCWVHSQSVIVIGEHISTIAEKWCVKDSLVSSHVEHLLKMGLAFFISFQCSEPQKLFNIANELLHTEEAYVKRLHLLDQVSLFLLYFFFELFLISWFVSYYIPSQSLSCIILTKYNLVVAALSKDNASVHRNHFEWSSFHETTTAPKTLAFQFLIVELPEQCSPSRLLQPECSVRLIPAISIITKPPFIGWVSPWCFAELQH